ncbi:MAG: CAP domain-containing protein [Actinomycetota bacterium]|nr:CAP domain-containing protein [Actinomycetota bacterium]MDQ5807749.1 CAP domain-containing protein [Actinomycetota bacterium]
MTNRRLRRVLGLLPLALVLALPAAPAQAGPTACAAADSSPVDASVAQLEHTVLCLVNRERTSRGLSRLRANDRLERAARGHSRNMVARNFFAHDSLGGASVLDRVKRRGYRSSGRLMVGENIAWGSGSYATPAEIVDGWMNSSGHRANILHRAWDEIGVGVAVGAPRPTHGQPAATYTTDFGARG